MKLGDDSFNLLSAALSPALKHEIDDLFMVKAGNISGWLKLKPEPKNPTNPEVCAYLAHLAWLKAWVARLPAIDHLAAPKLHQYMLEARALGDAVNIFLRKLRKLHATGAEQLERYFTEHRRRAEKIYCHAARYAQSLRERRE